jgi:dTMP kinase
VAFERAWPGVFLVFEGIDGAGKSSQINILRESLEAAGETPVVSREPTDGPWGRRIRESASTGRMTPAEELEAFILDRTEHLSGVVMPALLDGRVVILDRYFYSTIAYQGTRAGVDVEAVRRRMESLFPEPDLVLLLDVEPEVALRRIVGGRGETPNEFERREGLERARAVFLSLESPRIRRIDASLGEAEVAREVARAVALGPLSEKRPGLAARLRGWEPGRG